MTRDKIMATLRRHLSADVVDRLAEHITTGVRLRTARVDMSELALGASRIGGIPDLPADFEWPTKAKRPLQFLAQLRLADFSEFSETRELGDRGWLYFFYDASDQPWGFDPKDRGGWAVRYCDADNANELKRTEIPPAPPDAAPPQFEDYPTRFHACSVVPELTSRLPDIHDLIETLELDLADDIVEKLSEELQWYGSTQHQVLGEPATIQGDMRLECQLVSNGLYTGDGSGYEDPRAAKLKSGAAGWRLLIQVDTDEDGPGWMWGDCGMLYFWVREQELTRREFDNVWLILQCF